MEAQTGYFFYYDPAQSDSLKVNLQIKEQPLRKVLEQVFKDTELKYAMDNQKRVFITLGQEIITQLPAGLFEPDNAPAKEREVANYIPPNNEEEEKLLSTAENKLYEIGIKTYRIREGNATLTGYVRNALTGEPVIGAAVLYRKPSNRGCYRCAGSLFHLTSPWKASVAD